MPSDLIRQALRAIFRFYDGEARSRINGQYVDSGRNDDYGRENDCANSLISANSLSRVLNHLIPARFVSIGKLLYLLLLCVFSLNFWSL